MVKATARLGAQRWLGCALRPMAAGLAVSLALLTALNSCTSATIYRMGRPNLEAEIIGGTDEVLYVRNGRGVVLALRRSRIADISHPGKGLLVTSVPPLAIGALFLGLEAAVAMQSCQSGEECEGPLIPLLGIGLAFVGVGIALAAGGLASRSASVHAMNDWVRPADLAETATPGQF
jgi:hypothetical protein